jgi:localization factor PodJL
MRRNAPTGPKSLDLEIREAVEAAARRSGLSLEAWLAADTEPRRRTPSKADRQPTREIDAGERSGRTSRRPPAPGARAGVSATDRAGASQDEKVQRLDARDPAAGWVERAAERLEGSARDAADGQDRLAVALSAALCAIKDRLDTAERRAAEAREPAAFPILLETLAALRSEIADLGKRVADPDPSTPALEAVRRDLASVRADLDRLASRDEVAALEHQVRGLADDLARSPVDEDGPVVAGAAAALREQLQHIAADLATGLHRRIAGEMDAITARIEQVSAAGRSSVESLGRQIDDMRQVLARGARQDQMARLAAEVAALRRHIVDTQLGRLRPVDLGAVGRVLDDIRSSVKRSEDAARATGVPQQLESLSRRLDLLLERPESDFTERMSARLAELTEHMAAVAAGSADSARAIASRVDQRLAGIDEHLTTLASEVARPAERATTVLNDRMSDLAGHVEALSTVGTKPVEALAARVDRRLNGLDERLSDLASEIARPVEILADRVHGRLADIARPVQVLSDRFNDRLAALAAPIEALAGRVDERLAGLDDRLECLAKGSTNTGEVVAERLSQQLADLTDRLTTLIAAGAKPVSAVQDRVDHLSGQVSALARQVGTPPQRIAEGLKRVEDGLREIGDGPKPLIERFDRLTDHLQQVGASHAPVIERLDRLEDGLRALGEQADTAPLEVMVRSLQERLESMPGTSAYDRLDERLPGLLQQLSLTASEPVQQALTETLTLVRGLRGEAAIIAERAARAALRDMPVTSGSDGEAVRQALAELKAMQASAEKKTQATLKAVHNALETLVLRAPAGPGTPPAGALPPDLPAARLESAVRKLHVAVMAQAEDATAVAREAADRDEVLLDPGAPRSLVATPGASFPAAQEGESGSVRSSFIAAARRAAQAATAEAATAAPEDADDNKRPISNHTLIARIRQTFDIHRRPLLLGLALLLVAVGSIEVTTGFREDPAPAVARSAASDSMPAPTDSAAGESPSSSVPQVTGSLPEPAGAPENALAGSGPAIASQVPADLGPIGELPAAVPASLRTAALAGDPAAQFDLATRFAEGRGLTRDLGLAAKLFDKAAQAGLAPAQFHLGNLHEKGVGVPRDPALARIWYERAASAGNTRAMHNLAVLYAEGADGKPDYAAAARWFLEAAEHGVRDSQFNLGVLLARGLGARQDLAQSYKWFALAAAEGDEDAAKKRDEVAVRLAGSDLAAAKALVAGWRPRAVNPGANEIAPPAQGWSAAPARTTSHRS